MNKIGYHKISKNLNVRKPRSPNMERDVIDFFKGRKMVYDGFESGIVPSPGQSIVLAKPEKSNLSETYQSTQPHQKNEAHQSTLVITMNMLRPEENTGGR